MQCLEASGAVRPIYGSLGVKRLSWPRKLDCMNKIFKLKIESKDPFSPATPATNKVKSYFTVLPTLIWLDQVTCYQKERNFLKRKES